VAERSERYKEAGADDRASAIAEVKWWKQMLRNLAVGLVQGLVVTEDMSRAEAEELMLKWRGLPMEQRARNLPLEAKASVELAKAIELLQGHPTDRVEFMSSLRSG